MEGKLEDTTENPRSFGDTSEPEGDEQSLKATPEEQEDYELLTIRARKMIFGKTKEKVLSLLGSSQTPAEGIGKAGSLILKSLVSSAERSGREISPDAVINAGTAIAVDLNDLGKAKKVFQYDSPEEEEKQLKDGVLWGVKYYGDGMIKNGEITPDMQKMANQQVAQGIEEEQSKGPQKSKVASAVSEAVNPAPQGLVGGTMQEGM